MYQNTVVIFCTSTGLVTKTSTWARHGSATACISMYVLVFIRWQFSLLLAIIFNFADNYKVHEDNKSTCHISNKSTFNCTLATNVYGMFH